MAAPVFVAEYETAWTGNPSSLSKSVTTAVGDVLVIIAGESNGGGTLGTPTDDGPGLTYTLRQSIHVSTSWADAYVWTATATSAATFNITVAKTGGTPVWGFNVLRFSGSSGIGASSKTNVSGGAPSLGITTTGANSAIVVINTDWNAVDGASRTWRTAGSAATEVTYVKASTFVTDYGAYHADAGSAGAKTVGLSAPSGQKYSIIAVEILGGASSNTGTLSGTLPSVTGSISGSFIVLGSLSAALPKVTGSLTGTATNPATLTAAAPKVTGSITGTATNPGTLTGSLPRATGTLTGTSTNSGTLAGTLPDVTGTLTGTQSNPGTIAGQLPKVTGSITALTGDNTGTLNGTLPKVTGALTGTARNSGTLDATLPTVTGLITGTSNNPATLDGLLPIITAELVGTLTNPGTIAGTLPALVGAIAAEAPALNITIIAGPITCGWDAAAPLKGWSADKPSGDQWTGTAPTKGWTADQPSGDQWTGDKPTSAPWTGEKPVKGWTPGPVTK